VQEDPIEKTEWAARIDIRMVEAYDFADAIIETRKIGLEGVKCSCCDPTPFRMERIGGPTPQGHSRR
jgi:hypothetical protein